MLKKILQISAAVLMLAACSQNPKTVTENANPAASDGKHFGAMISADGATTYDEFLTKMQGDSMPAKIVGKIETVCLVKGCWMDFVSETDGSKQKMKVKFKDYAFFMPLDCAGRKAVVDGYAYTKLTDVAELKHLAEDAGKSKAEIDAITEPKQELRFMASGVVFVD